MAFIHFLFLYQYFLLQNSNKRIMEKEDEGLLENDLEYDEIQTSRNVISIVAGVVELGIVIKN